MTNTNESGRSMVEMLGVLAIIGVLSVMGIAGYTQAMKKYRTNEAVASISMGAMLCATGTGVSNMTFNYVTNPNCSGDAFTYTLDSSVEESAVAEMLSTRGNYSAGSFDLMTS